MRFEPRLNELCWIVRKGVQKCSFDMGIMQRLCVKSYLLVFELDQTRGGDRLSLDTSAREGTMKNRLLTSSSNLANDCILSFVDWTTTAIFDLNEASSNLTSTSHADGLSGGKTVGSNVYRRTTGSGGERYRLTNSGSFWKYRWSTPKSYTKKDKSTPCPPISNRIDSQSSTCRRT